MNTCYAATAVLLLVILALATAEGASATSRAPAHFEQFELRGAGTSLAMADFVDFSSRRQTDGTRASLTYDEHGLIVTFDCVQHEPVIATQSTDGIGFGSDDAVGIGLDTSANGARVYRFYVTPRGVRYQFSSEDARYEPPWSAEVKRSRSAWSARLVIPLDDLRGQNRIPQTWRINAFRHIASSNTDLSWAFDPRMADVTDSFYWPRVLLAIPRRATMPRPVFAPFLLSAAGADRGKVHNVGVDFSIPLDPTLNLRGTVNPDFTNVEADQVLAVPQQFSQVLTEYRPFFAEGNSYFANSFGSWSYVPTNVIWYSPSIGDFHSGGKVEGTVGEAAVGVLTVTGDGTRDSAYGLNIADAHGNASTRLFTDGVVATHGTLRDQTAEIGGKIANVGSGLNIGAQFEREQRNAATYRSSYAYAELDKANSSAWIGYAQIDPGYAPIDGYTFLDDLNGPVASASLWGSTKTWKAQTLSITAEREIDRSGHVHFEETSVSGSLTTNRLLSAGATITNSRIRSYSAGFPSYANAQTLPYNQTSLSLGLRDGTPSHLDVLYQYGPFAADCASSVNFFCQQQPNAPAIGFYQHYASVSGIQQVVNRLALSAEEDVSRESGPEGMATQMLFRLGASYSMSRSAIISAGVRNIAGSGGFAPPGSNVYASVHVKPFSGLSDLYVAYGSPMATQTLRRFIVKLVIRPTF